ncbi:MAG: tetratricopeptide repeat protein [Bacteroidota bacterium]
MKKAGLLSILFFSINLLCLPMAKGQDFGRIDSLQRMLYLTHDSKAKARLLLRISKEEEIRNPENALKYAQQARQIAQTIDYDSAEVRAMILMGVNYTRMMLLREAIDIGEMVVEKASRYDMKLEIADGRGIMAVAYAQVGDFDNSSKLYFENLKLYENLNERRLLGRTLGNIAADFISQQSYDKAMEYSKKALQIAKETNNLTLITDQYNNLAAIYQAKYHDLPKALSNYFEALKVAIKIDDFLQQGINTLNIGRVYQEMEKPDSAFYYMNQALGLFQKVNNPVYIADCHIALGDFHFREGEYTAGKELAMNALHIGKEYQIFQTISGASDLLQKIYLAINDTTNAFKYTLIRIKANDSIYALQSQKALFKAELQYNQEKIAKEQKIKQQGNYFIFGFIIFGLFAGLIIAILLYSRQKIKIKNTTLEKDKAEAELRFKSKELSINLLALLKKNDLITEIRSKFSALEKSLPDNPLKEEIRRFNNEIKLSADDRLWQEFSMRFKEINSEFYEKLLVKYPDLTQNELKLCAYLRLNMSTKEIAELTGQSPETLGTARYRLRKKFGLTNSESNLVLFLSQI